MSVVKAVISGNIIEVDKRWNFYGMQGSAIKIAGLLPPKDKKQSDKYKKELSSLILQQTITIDQSLYVTDKMLSATIKVKGTLVQNYFPERKIPPPIPSRLYNPNEKMRIEKVLSGIPTNWENPIASTDIDDSPFFGSIKYPTKPWDATYEENKKLVRALYSETHENKEELDKWFKNLLVYPQRETPTILAGEPGVGKSWYIANQLMSLPDDKYHKIVVDLRFTNRGDELKESIEEEIDNHLMHFIKDLTWLYDYFQSIYSKDFDPENQKIKEQMRDYALKLPRSEFIKKRLQYYNSTKTPELIIIFDNLDHFNEKEQTIVSDICRRVLGNSPGVRAAMIKRPTTRLAKSKVGLDGDAVRIHVVLKSPNIIDVIKKRMSINKNGKTLDTHKKLPGTSMSLNDIFEKYEKSDSIWGSARLIGDLCSSDPIRKKMKNSSYDLRHYLRLFRHFVRSDNLRSFDNIDKVYYAISTLMLKQEDSFNESNAFIFNLFDNEHPEQPGNALIRYRVLEYCNLFNDLGDIFDEYIKALGCNVEMARYIIELFEDTGLIKVFSIENKETPLHISAKLTIAGRCHLELIRNLWYIICIKTGMNIDADCILYDEEARVKATEIIRAEKVLSFYSKHGWVPEEMFIKFINMQEFLESKRIGNYQAENEETKVQIGHMIGQTGSPSDIIHWSYHEQISSWKKYNRLIL